MTDPDAKAPDALALTRMWGSTVDVHINDTIAADGFSVQFSDVRLPEPLDCSIYFHAERAGVAGTLVATTLELLIGLGRTNVKRTSTFMGQPTPTAPLDFSLPFQPMTIVQARAIVQGFKAASGTEPMIIRCTLQVAPVTRAQYEKEALKFGMALPGEADGMDDDLYEDLEENAPGVADIMRDRQANGEDPGHPDDYDEDVDRAPPRRRQIIVPPRFEAAIERVSRKLGRAARMSDLPPLLRSRLERAMARGRQA
jgi:hypothetical protein